MPTADAAYGVSDDGAGDDGVCGSVGCVGGDGCGGVMAVIVSVPVAVAMAVSLL